MRSIAYRFSIRVLALSIIIVALATVATVFAKPAEGDLANHTDEPKPLFDYDYDDSWVEKVPDVVAGYNVGYINTPKSMACLNTPIVSLQTTQPTLEDFWANPPDEDSLDSALRAVPGLPANVLISFSPKPIDRLSAAAWETDWNLKRIEHGCPEPWGRVRNNP